MSVDETNITESVKVKNAAGTVINPATEDTLAALNTKVALDADAGIKVHVQNATSGAVNATIVADTVGLNKEATQLAIKTDIEARLPAALDADGGVKVHLQNSPSGLAQDATLQTVRDEIGAVSATPTANTLQDRLKTLASTLASILAELDVALSSRASEATLSALKARADLLATEATLSSLNSKDFATQTTLAQVKTDLDTVVTRLDVALSTRASEVTLAAVNTTLGTPAQTVDVQAVRDRLPGALDADGGLKVHLQNLSSGTTIANQGTAAAVSGAWPVLVTDGVRTAPVSNTNGVSVDNKTLAPGASTETTLAGVKTSIDTRLPATLDADGGMKVHVQNSSGSSATMQGIVDDVATVTYSEGATGTVRITPTADIHVNLRNQSGNETGISGAPLRVDPTGATTQPVSGPLTDTQLRATAVPVSGPLTDTQLRATAVPVSATQGTSPWVVSGTVTSTPSGTQNVSVVSSVEVEVKNDTGNPIPVSASSLPLPTGAATETTLAGIKTGTDKIPASPSQEHVTAASPNAARLTDGAAFYKATTPSDTQPVSAASLPLPTGAATETTLAARLADSTFSTRINTQGQKAMATSTPVVIASDQTTLNVAIASSVELEVKNDSGNPLSVTGTVTSTPSGTQNVNLTQVGGSSFDVGPRESATSFPVVLATDTTLPLPSGAATATKQDTGNTSLSSIDSKTPTPKTLDYDTSVGTDTVPGHGILLPGSGGAVAGGTSTNPIRVDVTGTTAQPVTDNGGSLTVDGAVSVTNFPATQPVSGTVTANQGTAASNAGAWPVTDAAGSLTVDTTQLPSVLAGGKLDTNVGAWLSSTAPTVGQKAMASSIPMVIASDQTAIPVSGSFTITPSGTQDVNVTKIGGTALSEGQKTMAASIPMVIASDQTPIPISGSVTSSPSGTQNVNLTQIGGSAVAIGQALMAASLPVVLPSNQVVGTSNSAQDPAYLAPASTVAPTKAPVIMGKTSDATPQYQPLPLTSGGAAIKTDGTATIQPVSIQAATINVPVNIATTAIQTPVDLQSVYRKLHATSSASIGANLSYTSTSESTYNFSRLSGSVFANQACTVYVEESPDSTNWVGQPMTLLAGATKTFSVGLSDVNVRVRVLCGATPITVFRANAYLGVT